MNLRCILKKILDWIKYEITGEYEVTFTVVISDPKCFGLRSVVKESNDSLKVAIVEGILQSAPNQYTAIGVIEKHSVRTKYPAQNLKIRVMPKKEVKLNP